MENIIAVDTETTGPYLYHGCQPFAVSACDLDGNIHYWDFPVDPLTREVIYDRDTIDEIYEVLEEYDSYVMHNAIFDMRAFEVMDQSIYELFTSKPTHDTLLMSHIADSSSSHGLKPLSERLFGFPADDEKELKDACKQARAICRRDYPQWQIANKDHPTLPNHRGELAYCDYWLPNTVAHSEEYESNHRWYNICQEYAEKDAERTILLYRDLKAYLLEHDHYHIYKDHLEVREPVSSIQSNGIHFHRSKAKLAVKELSDEIHPLSQEVSKIAGSEFNYRSSKQLGELLYGNKFQLPIMRVTAKDAPSTSAGTLQDLHEKFSTVRNSRHRDGAHFIDLLLQIRKRETTIRYIQNYLSYSQKYVTEYDDNTSRITHYLHPSLNQTGTSTTRFSSSNPNGQNISKGTDATDDTGHKKRVFNLRELFGPPPGFVWYALDYKSLQLIIFAYEANDQGLIDTFLTGGDPHNYVACTLFNTDSPTELERRIAKNVNYALIFGAGERKIDHTAGMDGAYKLYKDQFPIVTEYMDKVVREAKRYGHVKTAWGYPITTPAEYAYRGVNYIIQGDEGEIVKRAMVHCYRFLKDHAPECSLVLQVHDELIFEAPQDFEFPLEEIADLMMKPARDIGWETPVDACLINKHWGSKEDLVIC